MGSSRQVRIHVALLSIYMVNSIGGNNRSLNGNKVIIFANKSVRYEG